MKKKKILFCVHNFNHGGISKGLQNILLAMDYERYEVSIFCACHEGPYSSFFYRYNCLSEDWILWLFCANYRKLRGIKKVVALTAKGLRKILMKFGCDMLELRLSKLASLLSTRNYDVVIAYAEGMITHFVAKIDNVKRLAWMHIDYRRFLEYGERPLDSVGHKFDVIISPSKYSASTLVELLPDYKGEVVSLRNLVDEESIKSMSRDFTSIDDRFDTSRFTIVSVGRVCYEKQFFEIPRIAAALKKQGLLFKWYIIGGGSPFETAILQNQISEHSVAEEVICLGEKKNPYPYMRKGDCVAVLSRSETFCYTIFEARTLGIPVVSTNFASAKEIMDNKFGMVTELQEFHRCIIRLANDEEYRKYYKHELQQYKYDNETILTNLYSLF